MALVGFLTPHPATTGGIHPEPRPEPGALPSVRDSERSLRPEPVSIVPGGGGAFALPSVSTTVRGRPAAASSATIHLAGASGKEYRIKDPHSKLPQWATEVDPETGGPTSRRRYVQQNDKGRWMPFEATPIKVPGHQGDYVIADASNTSTPQQVFERKPNGDLVEVPGKLVYDGNHGVKLGLKGGTDASKDVRNHRIMQAINKLESAYREEGEAQAEITRLEDKAREANAVVISADADYAQAKSAYGQAHDAHDAFHKASSSMTEADAGNEALRLKSVEDQKKGNLAWADRARRAARKTYNQVLEKLLRADQNLKACRRAVTAAESELKAAKSSSS
jgi:hypothetical protein